MLQYLRICEDQDFYLLSYLFLEISCWGVKLTLHLHLGPTAMYEWSHISTPPCTLVEYTGTTSFYLIA